MFRKISLCEKCLHAAFRTSTFQDVVDARQTESVGQFHYRHTDVLQTERAVTKGTVEMSMLVLDEFLTFTIVTAYIVLHRSTTVINGMYQSVSKE